MAKRSWKVLEAQNKLVLLDFYTGWCGYCKKMDRDVFSKKDFQKELNQRSTSPPNWMVIAPSEIVLPSKMVCRATQPTSFLMVAAHQSEKWKGICLYPSFAVPFRKSIYRQQKEGQWLSDLRIRIYLTLN